MLPYIAYMVPMGTGTVWNLWPSLFAVTICDSHFPHSISLLGQVKPRFPPALRDGKPLQGQQRRHFTCTKWSHGGTHVDVMDICVCLYVLPSSTKRMF